MKEASRFHLLDLQHNISVAAARCGRYNVLVEREGYKDNDCKKINRGAKCTDCFWATGLVSAIFRPLGK